MHISNCKGIGSKFTNLHCFSNYCYYYHRGIVEVLTWSIVYSSRWIGELHSHAPAVC